MNRGMLWVQIPQRNFLFKTRLMTATILTRSKKEWSTLLFRNKLNSAPRRPLPAPSTSLPSHQHSHIHQQVAGILIDLSHPSPAERGHSLSGSPLCKGPLFISQAATTTAHKKPILQPQQPTNPPLYCPVHNSGFPLTPRQPTRLTVTLL